MIMIRVMMIRIKSQGGLLISPICYKPTSKVERDQTNAAIKQQLSQGGGAPEHQMQPKVVQVNQPVSPRFFSFLSFLILSPQLSHMTYDFRRRNLLLPVSLKVLVLVQQSTQ